MDLELWKKVKKEKKLTNQELAEISCVPKRTIENIFSGHTKFPRADTVEAIEKALGLNKMNSTHEENVLYNLILQLTDEETEELSNYVDYIISKRK